MNTSATSQEFAINLSSVDSNSTNIYVRLNQFIKLRLLLTCLFIALFTIYIYYTTFFTDIDKEERLLIIFIYTMVIIYFYNTYDIYKKFILPYIDVVFDIFQETIYRDICTGFIFTLLTCFIVYLCICDPQRLYSLLAMCIIILICIVTNVPKIKSISWSPVLRSFNMHFILAILLIYCSFGRVIILNIGNGIIKYLNFTEYGARFIYGNMLIDQFIFAFFILSSLYLSFVTIAFLRYYGFMTFLEQLAEKFAFIIGVSIIEGSCGIINMFLSMTETCVLMRSNLMKMTTSQKFVLVVTGLSTVSVAGIFAYVQLGANVDYIITSIIISIPCCFMLCKICEPDIINFSRRHENQPLRQNVTENIRENDTGAVDNEHLKSLLDKCTEAIIEATFIIQVIIGNIITATSIIMFIDRITEIFMNPFLKNYGLMKLISQVFSYIFLILGVNLTEARVISEIFTTKVLINELVAYEVLGEKHKILTTERAVAIANVIICGFGNFSAVGMLTSLINSLTNFEMKISSFIFRALFVSCLVNIFCSCTIALLI